jgi:copper chaperone
VLEVPKLVETLKVEGMSCGHCVAAVEKAVNGLSGIKMVNVDLTAKTVTVDFDNQVVNLENIKEVIEEQGYDVL